MFENRVLRRIFGPKWNEVTGERRKLHNEELNDLYCSQNIARAISLKKHEIGGTCGTHGGQDRCIQSFGGEYWWKEKNNWEI